MWRHIVSNFLTIGILLLVALASVIGWAKNQYVVPGPLAEAICFKVERGSNFRRVADDLAAKGAISHPYIFKVGADYAGRTQNLKAGSYLIAAGASMTSVVATLTGTGQSTCGSEINYRIGVTATDIVVSELDPATATMKELVKFDPAAMPAPAQYADLVKSGEARLRVTLAEGVTSWQVVDALSRADFLTGDVKDMPAEGSLAPQQYEVERGGTRAALVAEMQQAQAAVLKKLWDGRATGLPYKSPAEAMIMASIVEKETGVAAERPKVASVFLNRLAQGMKLQTDPTVIYGLTKGKSNLGRGLRQSELRSNTPYNTYVIDGLPPTPIANPGAEAIAAVLNPAKTNYLYFVADGTGGHVFSETLEEHNANVAKWRKIQTDQGTTGN